MAVIWAEKALTAEGWHVDARVEIDDSGHILNVTPDTKPEGHLTGILLPAPGNLHSHAFQRAMAGLGEGRGPHPTDSFWTWRALMYRFLDHLTPEDIEAITAFVQMEMLEAGYAACGEFHYIHNQPGGAPYEDPAEMTGRIISAATTTGIGLTLLPVLYQHGGCDGRPLGAGQLRFGNTLESFAALHEAAASQISRLPADARIGVAPHSLRSVSREGLALAVSLSTDAPLHMHIAEQTGEVDEVSSAWGKGPVEWLLDNHSVDQRWCLIHCTQMTPVETADLAATGAVAGLCPVTEASLGDGIFNGFEYLSAGGRIGIGSDSNIRISLSEELRALEYSQRLRLRKRAVLARPGASTGRVLMDAAASGGAQALGRNSGVIEAGRLADLIALDSLAIDLAGKQGDAILDSFIFAGDDRMVRDVWSAGRHLVREGRHSKREEITSRYLTVMQALRGRL
jgi:formimidoylglutamate deiminase